jgi:hypothetical protein
MVNFSGLNFSLLCIFSYIFSTFFLKYVVSTFSLKLYAFCVFLTSFSFAFSHSCSHSIRTRLRNAAKFYSIQK